MPGIKLEPRECERCNSPFDRSFCQKICSLHKEMNAQRGFFSAYDQRKDSIAKAVRNR